MPDALAGADAPAFPTGTDAPTGADVIVVGGGIIGLATAWQLSRDGAEVVVIDPAPGTGASHAAAGMLAPIHEAYWGESHILKLNLAASRAWPAFADTLGTTAVDYRGNGMLMAAYDAGDKALLDNLGDLHEQEGLPVERLSSRECRNREPLLAPGVRGGVYSPLDHQVDPRRVVAELLNRVPVVPAAATEVTNNRVVTGSQLTTGERVVTGNQLTTGERVVTGNQLTTGERVVTGSQLTTGERVVTGNQLTTGERVVTGHRRAMACGQVVVAAGAWTGKLLGLPVRPVKGQILRLNGPRGLLRLPVRGVVRGSSVYAVPRSDGEIVVGATQEEQGFDTRVTAGGVHELLRDALTLLPGLSEIDLVETWAGLRPGTPDNAPIIGVGDDGIVYATGHYRNGILTAPITAAAVSALVQGHDPPVDLSSFGPGRFKDGHEPEDVAAPTSPEHLSGVPA